MALPGHSPPPPFTGPGSPARILNGHLDNQLPPMYGPPTRSMLPPSPQTYRFPHPPAIPSPSPSLPAMSDNRIVPPYKRPGSSMSISSMLGGEPEKSIQDFYPNHGSRGPSRQGSVSAPAPNHSSIMSPPYQPTKPGLGEYSYKPRAQTPEHIGPSFNMAGTRQRSSSSGTPLQRSAPFTESHTRSVSTIPVPRYLEQPLNPSFSGLDMVRSEQEDRARRTSLSGILQRPSSQPQPGEVQHQQQDPFRQHTIAGNPPERQVQPETSVPDLFHRNGLGTTYDIKPPGSHSIVRATGPQMSPSRAPSLPSSPDMRRLNGNGNGNQGRTLASILNGPSSQPPELSNMAAQKMARQDSSQSQGDRSIFGDRSKARQYSPFANPLLPQGHPSAGQPTDEPSRKGSDELSQHRALLGLAAESKKGRFSPMPQVMQGAQAQTPVPESASRTEHGRVFSGLGGGTGSTPTPTGASTRRDDGRTPLSEDNLSKVSRATPSARKRSRKVQDEDANGDTDMSNGVKQLNGQTNKKSKYQHSYKLDVDEAGNQSWQKRSTSLTGFNPNRSTNTSSNLGHGSTGQVQQVSQRSQDKAPALKPCKIIKVASVFNNASRTPRRHLGTFTYRPTVIASERRLSTSSTTVPKFEVSIRPNLLPSFSAAEHVNCTYTINVPKMWLQERERGLICIEHYLWGSGIYTDDSDPVAAAIHAGFLRASLGENVDTHLLSRVVKEQNPKIEWPRDIKVPEQPMEIQSGKDLSITMVVLPLLERYEGSARFGVISRMWPGGAGKAPHDGVSFAILKIEFVNIGTEEMRMGRTGASKKERMRADLEARQRGLRLQSDKIQQARKKKLAQIKARQAGALNANGISKTNPVPATITRGTKSTLPTTSSSPLSREVVLAVA